LGLYIYAWKQYKEFPCIAIFISTWQNATILLLSFIYFLLQKQRRGGQNRLCLKAKGEVVRVRGGGIWQVKE
jgi:hypothetical protein